MTLLKEIYIIVDFINGIERHMYKKIKEYEKNGKRRSPSRYGRFRREKIKINCG